MKNVKQFCLLYLLISLTAIDCSTVPTVRVPQPWIRSLRSTQSLQASAKLKIEVSGSTSPLLGNEQLTAARIRETLSYLLRRRGFAIDDKLPDYVVRLAYRTDRSDKFRFSSTIASSNAESFAIATGSGAGATSGLGVSIARAVSALRIRSTTAAEQTAEQALSYSHVIAIEIRNSDTSLVWKGESTWDSDELNLLNRIVPAIQLILSDLPSDRTFRPDVSEVKNSHIQNYFTLECVNTWFVCPALPYRIGFERNTSVNNRNALAAYVDLIQTAEYALPSGDADDWKNPIQTSLWDNVTLGAQYFLGPDRKPINVLIKLTGQPEGYYIDECWVADNQEYSNFQQRISKWQTALADYYDVFVH